MKAAGWGGIVFVVLSSVIVFVSPFWPPLGASAAEVVAYHQAHRVPFLFGNYLAIAAAIPSFAQIGGLTILIKRREGERGWLWIAVLSSALLAHAIGTLALVVYQVVPFAADPARALAAHALSDLAGVAFGCFMIALAGFVGFTTWATWKTGALPRWFGHVGAALCAASVVASAGAIVDRPAWLAGGGLASAGVTGVFFLWCAALAVLFLRMPEDT